jgi:hypothetical protein
MAIADIIFQPEQIDAMHAAFVVVCAKLNLRAGSKESDRIAARIVDLPKPASATQQSWHGLRSRKSRSPSEWALIRDRLPDRLAAARRNIIDRA